MDNLLNLIWILGKNLHEELTIRQLSIDAKIPYTTTHRIVLTNKHIFKINQKGNIKLCSLNLEDNIVKNYLILSEREAANKFIKKYPSINTLKEETPNGDNYCLVLFGSRAVGTHREKSDYDLCVISNDIKKKIKFPSFELLFNADINQMLFSPEEFKQMLEDKAHNVGKEIIKKHIVLHGEEYFWNLIYPVSIPTI